MLLVPTLVAFVRLTRPLVVGFNLVANGILRLFGVQPRDELEVAFTRGELAEMITDSQREGLLDDEESSRLARTLRSVEFTIADAMTPVEELVTLPVMPTVEEVSQAVAATGFSRFPLRDADGRLAGYLHVKDILDLVDEPTATVPTDRMRELPIVASDARPDAALAELRRAHAHQAVAVDRHGSSVGLVAMEDLLQYYVGAVGS